MDEAKLRAWWWHQQGLDGSLRGASPAPSGALGVGPLGGRRGPYLTSRALRHLARGGGRGGGGAGDHELPSAAAAPTLVPASDFALALPWARRSARGEETAAKLGVAEAEIEALCQAVLRALEAGPLAPDPAARPPPAAPGSAGRGGEEEGPHHHPPRRPRLRAGAPATSAACRGTGGWTRSVRLRRWEPTPSRAAVEPGGGLPELARRFFGGWAPRRCASSSGSRAWVKVVKEAARPSASSPSHGSDRLRLA